MIEQACEERALGVEAQMRHIAKAARAAASDVECCVCMEPACMLDGLFCAATRDEAHFVCDQCFAGWVRSECTPANGHTPYAIGEVWCVHKPQRGELGCASSRPFSPKVCP
jgi:hypothetical protein